MDKSEQKFNQLLQQLTEELEQTRHQLAQEAQQRQNLEKQLHQTQTQVYFQYQELPLPAYTWEIANNQVSLVKFNQAALNSTFTSNLTPDHVGKSPRQIFLQQPKIERAILKCFQKQKSIRVEYFYDQDNHHTQYLVKICCIFIAPNQVILYQLDSLEAYYLQKELVNRYFHQSQQSALVKLSKLGIMTTDLQSLMDQVIKVVTETLNTPYGHILELLPHGHALLLKAGVGWQNGLVGSANIGVSHNLDTGYTLNTIEPVIFHDLPLETRFTGSVLLHNHHIVSGVNLTIYVEDKIFGIMGVYTTQEQDFTEEQIGFIQAATHILSAAILRHQQQEKLYLLERAINVSSNGILISDAIAFDNPIIYVNQGFEKITGYTAEEVIGKNCRFLQNNDQQQPVIKEIHEAIFQGKEFKGIIRNYHKDGSLFWNELYINPVHNAQGHLTHFIGIQTDITERQQSQQALFESETLLRTIFEQAAVGMTQVSLDGHFLKVNQKTCEIFGYSESELLKFRWQDLTFPDEIYTDFYWIEQLLNKSIQQFSREKPYLKKDDDSIIWGKVNVSLVSDEEGKPKYFIAAIIDITQRKQMESMLVQQSQTLETFSTNLKHLHRLSTNNYSDLESIFTDYLKVGSQILQLEIGTISQVIEDILILRAVYSPLPNLVPNLELNINNAYFCKQVIQHQKTIDYNKDTTSHPQNPDDVIHKFNLHSYLGTPIFVNGKVYGNLTFSSQKVYNKNFEIYEIEIIELMAQTLGKFIANYQIEIERSQIENALAESQERLDSILTSLEDVVWSASLDNKQILYINPVVEKIYHHPVSEFLTNSWLWFQVIHPDDQPRVKISLEILIKEKRPQDLEYRIIRPNGDIRWIRDRSHLVYDKNNNLVRIDGMATDITEQKNMEAQLIYNACHDALTGLSNRLLFIERLKQAITKNQNNPDYLFAVLLLDLDNFKYINDSLGHLVGDKLLVAIADKLKCCILGTDTISRFGGDEFTILLEPLENQQEAIDIANSIHSELNLIFDLDGYEVFVTVSIGIVFSSSHYQNPEEILRDADLSMYKAKQEGRNRHAVFNLEMHDKIVKRVQLENDLRRALEREELVVYYQPIVSLITNKLVSFEALIRWQHPQHGLISPLTFIPIAEETGLIIPIGKWILEVACHQLKIWHEKFRDYHDLTVGVNLSSRQLKEVNFIDIIDSILAKTQISGQFLKLEITESVLMENFEKAKKILIALRERNIKLCLDDFGTGYSSLSYLHRFPINTLKIDQSFVKFLGSKKENLEIINAIITLSHSLDMDVIAEGIENESQFNILTDLNCEYGQGYLFSKPLDAENIEALLSSSKNPFFIEK